MATLTVTQANRAYDHLYDPIYFQSHGNDHARQTSRAMFGLSRIERVPDDKYMFSELPHYPRHAIQVSPKVDVPQHVDMTFTSPAEKAVASLAEAHVVYGSNRYKFFARPNKQMLSTLPHIVMYAMKAGGNKIMPDGTTLAPEPASKTVGTQSVFRESEAQTDPYSPDYYIAPHQVPEVLTLTHLAYGQGLPATEAELKMIERTRQKRVFQQMLPPPTDDYCLAARVQLMEMQEFREWADREKQIKGLQEKRLFLLQAALEERDAKRESKHEEKVDRMRQRKEEERDRFLAGCQRERTKVLRKLEKERRTQEGHSKKRDVIAEHADFTSRVYAPLARQGHVPDYNTARIEVQPADLTTFPGLLQLEASLPASLLTTVDRHPKDFGKKSKSSHTIRKELEMASALKSAMDGIKKELHQPSEADGSKLGDSMTVAMGGLKKFPVQKFLERPDSPRTKEEVLPEEEGLEAAVLLVQRLMRGRAYQNQMFEGKEKRLDLINELRAAERYAETATTVEEKRYVDQLREKAFDGVLESIQGSVISQTLDQLSKELLRFQQERHIAAMVKLAERDRQMRQAQESGRRQAEERLREREDEMFRQVMGVHQGTVDSYLEDVLTSTVEQAAQSRALTEARLKASKINQVVDALEASEQDPETVVRELVHSFGLPHVQREVVQRRVAVENKRFAEAATGALDETYRRVQHNLSL